MILSKRLLWTACAMLCLASLAAACGGQPSATEGTPAPVGGEPAEPGTLNATPSVATEISTTPVPPRAEPAGVEPPETGWPPTVPASAQQPATPSPGSAPAKLPDELLEVILADLAMRVDVEPEEIVVVRVEGATWPDTSLGCPQPGLMYAQVLTPGYRVVLEAGGARYEYHTDGAQAGLLCEKEVSAMEAPSAPGIIEPGLEMLIELARDDLAQRLPVSLEQIGVLEARAVVWPDASLGCPVPGMRYRQVPMDGALIRLRVGDKEYEYHSGGGRAPFLCEPKPKPLVPEPTIPKLDLIPPTPGSEDD